MNKLCALLLSISCCNCLAAPATLDSPPQRTEVSRRGQQFTYTPVEGAIRYLAYVGTADGLRDIAYINVDGGSFRIEDIPAGIDDVYVRLWTLADNGWSSSAYRFRVRAPVYYPQLDGAINDHDAQLWGFSSQTPVGYDETVTGMRCDDAGVDTVSTCDMPLNLLTRTFRNDQYQRTVGQFADGAVSALINVKLKAWALNKGGYCQIAVRAGQFASQIDASDFVAHTEVFGDDNWKLGGRKITYQAIPFTVTKDGNFNVRIHKEIIGECEVSVAFNVLGIYK